MGSHLSPGAEEWYFVLERAPAHTCKQQPEEAKEHRLLIPGATGSQKQQISRVHHP